ncbi:MAG: histidine--tRNA ligase, partial [Arcobacter skirrowii]|nr:histidine--tRNA ligase [Aliarcobacter skirrowii]
LDCKNEKCQTLLKDAPKITNSLCSSCDSDFEKLKEILDFNKVDYEIDSNLVRGLDYYNKTAFEFVSNEIGAQSAIAGGGRYDRLVEYLGGKSTAGIGFAIGIERLLELVKVKEQKQDSLYIGVLDETSLNKAFEIAIQKRKTTKTYLEYTPRGFAKHFSIAEKLNCNIVALIGENELNNNTIYIKNIETKEEKTVSIREFISEK